MSNKKRLGAVTYGFFVFLLFAESAQAYVDPGTGSYLFQLLIAGVLGSLFFIKTIIRSVRDFFAGFLGRKSKLEAVTELNDETDEDR